MSFFSRHRHRHIDLSVAESRRMGTTEGNWCRAVDGGTGTSVTAILLAKSIGIHPIQAALSVLLASQPLLRAQITDRQGKLWLHIDDSTALDVEIINKVDPPARGSGRDKELWLQIMEDELNTGFPVEKPFRVIQARLYNNLPNGDSLVVVKLHPSAADYAAAVFLSSQLLKHLQACVQAQEKGQDLRDYMKRQRRNEELRVPSLEDAIPRGKAKKPFWAHGIDVLGYGLSAFRHALLPLEDVVQKRESRLIIADFTESATRNILEMCKRKSSHLSALLNAASLKAVAKFKGTGAKGESYASAVLLNCRPMLEPVISDSTAGFYDSAILNTMHVAETVPLWELAAKYSKEFDDAVKKRKHFTDMGDLNMLMVQAMTHPALIPSSSMRTSLVTSFHDPPSLQVEEEVVSSLKVRDCVTCSSSHGMGPCLALYPRFNNGCLRVSFVYCSPLFSAATVQALVDDISSMLNNLS